jgi:hypothetical protein
MEVRIGVVHTSKELSLELDGTADDVAHLLDEALQTEDRVVWLTDAKGRRVGVPAAKVAYIEIDADGTSKKVGFGRG